MNKEKLSIKEYASELGIGGVTVRKLANLGIYYVEDILMFTREELLEFGISERIVGKLVTNARQIYFKVKKAKLAQTAEELEQRGRRYFTTGCKSLDELLGGGIEVGVITEFAGEFGSGKTQICHQLCVTVQLPEEQGGLNAKAVYIDTEKAFSWERITHIAKRFGLNPDYVKRNIFVIQVSNVEELEYVLKVSLRKEVDLDEVGVLLVDCLVSHFRSELIGLDKLAMRQQRLNYAVNWLFRYATRYNLAVVYTNQVTQVIDSYFRIKRPTGGTVLEHAATHRVQLLKGKENISIAKILDSPRLPRISVEFKITENGIEDV